MKIFEEYPMACISFLFMLFTAILVILPSFIGKLNEQQVTFTVNEKGIKNYSETGIYLLYTDEGVFKIADSIAYFRFDSSDLYGQIEVGETYECTVSGWRIPILSEYQNVIIATKVED